MVTLSEAVQIKNELNDDMLKSEQTQWNFQETFWVYTIRLFTTMINLFILTGSVIAVVLAATQGKVLARNEKVENQFLKFILEYLVSITMGGTSIIAPIFFKILISFQKLRSETKTNQVNRKLQSNFWGKSWDWDNPIETPGFRHPRLSRKDPKNF